MNPVLPYADVVREPIDPSSVLGRVGADEDGAALLFLGVVRNHADGRPVTGMQYEAYEDMAVTELRAIVAEASASLGTPRIAAVHRVGELSIGDVAVAVAVSSPHRAEAYDASRFVMEEIKRRLPVWKRERYRDGEESWVPGVRPPVGDGAEGTR